MGNKRRGEPRVTADLSAYRKQKRVERLTQGLCPLCSGKRPVDPGRKSCGECRAWMRQYQSGRRKETQKAGRRLYISRVRDGICPRCGGVVEDPETHITCDSCRAKQRARYRAYADSKE